MEKLQAHMRPFFAWPKDLAEIEADHLGLRQFAVHSTKWANANNVNQSCI